MTSQTETGIEPWRNEYAMGVQAYRQKMYANCVDHLSLAVQMGADRANVYDLRAAAVMEGDLGRPRDALRDAKKVIQLAPDSHQGYARAATIFAALRDLPSATVMTQQALQRLSDVNLKHEESRTRLLHQLAGYEERRKRLACHVATLPVEILSVILTYGAHRAIEDKTQDARARASINNTFLVRASHVCRHWRAVALGNTTLWQSLVLGLGEGTTLSHKAEAWATRAKGSIRELLLLPPISNQLHVPQTSLVLTLRKHLRTPPKALRIEWSSYLQSRHLTATSQHCLWFVAAFGRANIPLEELELLPTGRKPPGDGSKWDLPWYDYGIGDGVLRALSMQEVHFDWDGRSSAIKGLTTFTLRQALHRGGGLSSVLSRLSDNPDLEHLTLGGSASGGISMTGHVSSGINLARLQLLQLEGKWVDAPILLEHLTLPCLHTLRLHDMIKPVCRTLRGLKESPMLKELHLRACHFDPMALAQELQRIGGRLEVLEIHSVEMDVSTVVQALAGHHPKKPMKKRGIKHSSPTYLPCPNISKLVFGRTPKLSGMSIKHFVKSRLPDALTLPDGDISAQKPTGTSLLPCHGGPRRIQSLTIEECEQVDPELIPWLRTVVPTLTYTPKSWR